MGTVRRKANGRWEARWRDPNGRVRGKTYDTKGEARRHLDRVSADQQRGVWTDPALGRITLDKWIDQWWATTTNLRPSTRARDLSYITTHLRPALGGTRLERLDHLTVRQWAADLQAKGLAPATVQKAFQILNKILASAVQGRLITHNPCDGVPLPRIERTEMRFLTPPQVALLADTIHPRFRAMVLVGAYGGLRFGELAGLRATNVDPLRGRLKIVESMTEVSGHLNVGPPKSEAGRRSLTLPQGVTAELQTHLTTFPPGRDDLVFTSPRSAPLRRSTFRTRFWLPAIEKAEVAPLRLHDLRHTAVAFWIEAGATPVEIAARAGHTSVSVVLDRYGHLLPGADERLRDRLDELFYQTDSV